MPVPALLLVAALLLTPAATTLDAHASVLGRDASAHARSDGDAASARVESPAGWQQVHADVACVPDWDSRCDTEADCLPGSLNCYATRRERSTEFCTYQPDGTFHCRSGNETAEA